MGDTTPERLTKVETLVEVQQKQLDEHENRIGLLEDMGIILDKLSDTVDRQSTNIDKIGANTSNAMKELIEIINDVKSTTQELKLAQTRIETKQSYWVIDGVIGMCKKIGLKGLAIIVGCAVAGLTWAQQIFHIFG